MTAGAILGDDGGWRGWPFRVLIRGEWLLKIMPLKNGHYLFIYII